MRGAVLRRELTAVGLSLLAAFLLGALVFQQVPVSGRCWDATGVFGPVGTFARCSLVVSVGIPGAVLIAIGCLVMALRMFGTLSSESDAPEWGVLFAGIVLLVPIAIGLALGGPTDDNTYTGLWGGFVAYYMRKAMGPAGAWILFVLGVSVLSVATLRWNPIRMLVGPARGARDAQKANAGLTLAERMAPSPDEMPAISSQWSAEAVAANTKGKRGKDVSKPVEVSKAEDFAPPGSSKRAGATTSKPSAPVASGAFGGMHDVDDEELSDELPPTSILAEPPARNVDAGIAELDAAGLKLMAALRTFKVEGTLVGRTTGPTVTQFEIEPAPGVKVRQIAMLADDLALAMRAPSIRIVAPIPGRGAVGVEVPNPNPEMVVLREVLESADFRQARAALPIALGKDLEGRAIVADLAKMPHLLIAGTTGSGKSVCVNTIITSLVYRHTPKTLRFLMVDPKMVELSVYNSLPHLRHKVITDNRDAASVLKWAVMEMQDRYRLLEANSCRNLQEFNKRVQSHESGTGTGPAPKKPRSPDIAFEDMAYTGGVLPYIVVIIDEMADLMMTVQGEVETPIAMLAQKARAIGIHLILATQRPSVNVITGLIKANFPSRIAFRVATQIDSRTIIDGSGAESLLGNGDMLFIPPGKSEPSRLQGAYLSSEDTEKLLEWFEGAKARRAAALAGEMVTPELDILEAVRAVELRNAGGDEDADESAGDRDVRFREAAETVIQHRQGSTSLLQRRLKVGYGRAARMIDQLEEAGILAASEGASRPRDVLVGLEDLDRICGSA
ncbi:MAG: DNA translocase FtsK [Gemmatimonadaceae bacterium]